MIRENALSIRELTVGGLFAALITAGAWVKITLPTQPLPMHFTLQWFFVLLAGLLLNKKLAGASVAVYLFLGLMGFRCLLPGEALPILPGRHSAIFWVFLRLPML